MNTIPPKETIDQTIAALTKNGFAAVYAENAEKAKEMALNLIPENSEVMTMTSETLRTLGLEEYINTSGKYNAIKPRLMQMDRNTQGKEMKQLGSVPDIAIGSVQAVTENGEVLIASRTGSQTPAYVYGAGKVLWIVGAQKIVKDLEEGKKRIFEYVLPLESERANAAYHMTGGSKVTRLLTYFTDETPDRVHIILVGEPLGF